MPDFFQNLLAVAGRTAPQPVTSGPVSRSTFPASQTTLAPQPFDAVLTQAVAEQTTVTVPATPTTAAVPGEPLLPGEVRAEADLVDITTADDVIAGGGLLAAAGLVVPPVIGLPQPVGNTLSLTGATAVAVTVPETVQPTTEPISPTTELPPTLVAPTADRTRAD